MNVRIYSSIYLIKHTCSRIANENMAEFFEKKEEEDEHIEIVASVRKKSAPSL